MPASSRQDRAELRRERERVERLGEARDRAQREGRVALTALRLAEIFEEVELSQNAIKTLCDPHFGPGADGVLVLTKPDEPGYDARLRIYNPDGSEAELSGNGAREAILYLRRHWTDADTFSIQTLAGEIRPTILSPTTCRVDMGRASLTSANYPSGGPDGTGEVAGYLQRDGISARTVTTKLRYADFSIRSRSTTLPTPIDEAERIGDLACRLLDRGLAAAYVALSVVLGTLQLVETWRSPAPGDRYARLLERASALRLVNRYGPFKSMTQERPEIVIEASDDGLGWPELGFRYKPGDVARAPGWNVPH